MQIVKMISKFFTIDKKFNNFYYKCYNVLKIKVY